MRRTLSPFLFITSLAFGGVLHAAEKEPIQPITAAIKCSWIALTGRSCTRSSSCRRPSLLRSA